MSSTQVLSVGDYTIGWICALPLELAAARLMLDEIHPNLTVYGSNDHNNYLLGSIAGHNVVIACLPAGTYGTVQAAVVSQQMLSTFHRVRFGLLVGVAGGVPSPSSDDIRLGDIVVGLPGDQHPGVIQRDFGKRLSAEELRPTGALNKPPQILLTAVSQLQAAHKHRNPLLQVYIKESLGKEDAGQFKQCFPGQDQDQLFNATYEHKSAEVDCSGCDPCQIVERSPRGDNFPIIHYGLIASGNQVMKHGLTRDRLAQQNKIKCFEMEAAGLMDNFSSLVIRGICDYADSHKNKHWQDYAALAASAYAKELLGFINVREVDKVSLASTVFEKSRVKSEIREWISADADLDVRDELKENLSRRHRETCSWLFKDERFMGWRDSFDDNQRILWYNAPPGSGKTILSSIVVHHLNEMNHKTAYFCYSFNKLERRDVVSGIRSIAIQLIQLLRTGIPDKVVDLYRTERYGFDKKLMREALAEAVVCDLLEEDFSLIYFIIDGLDECCDEERMRRQLSSLVSASGRTNGNVKWFFTSRDDGKIRDMMKNLGASEICPCSSIIYADIKLFVTNGLHNLMDSANEIDDPNQIDVLANDWLSVCDGSFLYSRIVLDTLGGDGITCYGDIWRVLDEFPRGLNDYYIRTLLKLCGKNEVERNLVRRTFTLLIASAQPITWRELRHALSISQDRTDHSPFDVPFPKKIKELCGSFLIIDRSCKNENDCKVRLCHKTVQDFLLQDPKHLTIDRGILGEHAPDTITSRLYKFFVNQDEASAEIGLDCLQLLSYRRYDSASRTKKILDEDDESDAFLKYAATFWFYHLNDASKSQEIFKEIRKFLAGPNFWTCVTIQSYIDPHLFGRYKKISGHYRMCLDDPTLNDEDPLGVPLPDWFHEHPAGRKWDLDFCNFLNDWHQVLASHPGVLDRCVLLNKMTSPLGNHLPQSDSIQVFNVGEKLDLGLVYSLCTNSLFFYKNRLHIEAWCSPRAEYDGDVLQEKIRYYCLPMFSRKKAFEKEFHVAVQGIGGVLEKEMSCWYRSSDEKMEAWKVAESGLSLEHYFADGRSQVFQAPTEWQKQNTTLKASWQVVWKDSEVKSSRNSVVFHLIRQAPDLDRKNNGDDYKPGDNAGDSDGGEDSAYASDDDENQVFRADRDTGLNSSDSDSDSDLRSESSYSDKGHANSEKGEGSKGNTATDAVVLVRESSCPVWILLRQAPQHGRGFTCAIHPELPVIVWSYPGAHCLDPGSHNGKWHIERWSGDLETESSYAPCRQLRFSACGNYLYCLEASFTRGLEHIRHLVLSIYHFSHNRSCGVLIENGGPIQEITYKISERLLSRPIDHILAYWTDDEVVVALPPLTCKPKVIKFGLCTIPLSNAIGENQGQHDETAIQKIQILRDPVYFPSISGRDPKLLYQAKSSSRFHSLFLYLGDKPRPDRQKTDSKTSATLPTAPVVLRWHISRENGWRNWQHKSDGECEDWNQEIEVVRMLRGGFVNGESRFNVPTRSGLNWTRKAYLSCY